MVSICDAVRSYPWMWLHRTKIWATRFHHRWFVAGSILTMLIPAFPLISLYLPPSKRFWPTSEAYIVPVDDHAAAYSLLVGCGIFYILGSLFLVRFVSLNITPTQLYHMFLKKISFSIGYHRAFPEPPPKPLFPCSILVTDEVVSSWLFFLGTVPLVPLTCIYVVYFPGVHYYQIALIFCIAAR